MKSFTYLVLLVVLTHRIPAWNIDLPRADIIHATSGLILRYLSDYKPANRIVTFTVTLPMVPDMCYLIPIMSMRKIPQCNHATTRNKQKPKLSDEQLLTQFLKNSAVQYRKKRLIGDIISIGVGSAALALSTVNTVQIANLKSEMNQVTESIRTLEQKSNYQTAQILHLNEGQMKLAYALNFTQVALNRTIDLVNEHSEIIRTHDKAIRTLSQMTMFLSNRFSSFVHAVETHFIHTSIENILANKLNLEFIHHKDLQQVAELVMKTANISVDENMSTLTPVELITRLLVQQRIDFKPSNTTQENDETNIIGHLIFSSFFAAPNEHQQPFLLYELAPIPFSLKNQRVQLAQVPFIIGIEPASGQFVRWSKAEAESCSFTTMTTCRETPALRKDNIDSCLVQILNDSSLTTCQIEPYLDQIFVKRLGKHWIISTNTSTKCHLVKMIEAGNLQVGPSNDIELPPVAVVTTEEGTALSCDHFFLPGQPMQVGPTITILEESMVQPMDKQLFDLHNKLLNNTKWSKVPYIPPNIQTLLEFLSNTPTPPPATITHLTSHSGLNFSIMVFLTLTVLSLAGLVLYRTRSKKMKSNNVTIALPTFRQLEDIQMMNGK